MKVIFSGLVSSMTGSFAGASIRRYRQGYSCYPKVNEKKTKNQAQSRAMNSFALIAAIWNSLNDSDKNDWSYFKTVMGYDDYSTYNFYIAMQTAQTSVGLPIIPAINFLATRPIFLYINIASFGANVVFDYEYAVSGANTHIKIFVREISNGTQSVFYQNNPLRKIVTENMGIGSFSVPASDLGMISGNLYAIRIVSVLEEGGFSIPTDFNYHT